MYVYINIYLFVYIYIYTYIIYIICIYIYTYIYIYIEYLWVRIPKNPKNPLTLVAFLVGRVFATKGAGFGGLATAQLETSEVQPGGVKRPTEDPWDWCIYPHGCHTFKRNVGI